MDLVVLDTETTGLEVSDGHRVIELGCVLLCNRKHTDTKFHYYINPGRVIDAEAREGIAAEFDLFTTTVAEASTSADGSTTKIVVSLQDGHRVEAVVMRHDKGRNTLCVSSQVGCAMKCSFCLTGDAFIL